MVLQAVTVVLGYFTWSQFGWRTYSKLACDMRIKNAQQLRVTYILMNCYQTLLKLDFQVGILHGSLHQAAGREPLPERPPLQQSLPIADQCGKLQHAAPLGPHCPAA